MRVLFIKPSSLGDIVHALPVAHALRRHPGVEALDWVVNPEFAPLLESNPDIARVIRFPRRRWRALGSFVQEVRAERYGWVVDVQGLMRSALIARAARRDAGGRLVGMSDAREGAGLLYGEKAEVPEGGHAIARYRAVLEYLGVSMGADMVFPLPPGSVPQGLPEDRPLAVIHPYSRWATKEIPAETVRALVAAVPEYAWVIVGNGAPMHVADAADWSGRTNFSELLGLLGRAACVVSSDSGPMHLAAALGRPLVALFGPTSPEKTGPWTANSKTLTGREPCAPCFSRSCSNARHLACMHEHDAGRIAAAIREVAGV